MGKAFGSGFMHPLGGTLGAGENEQ